MFQINEIIAKDPFSLSKNDKSFLFYEAMNSLTKHHYQNCREYKSILDAIKYNEEFSYNFEQLPFLPVHLFKDYQLLSINKEFVFKTLNSSGTSGQEVSKIYL